MTENGRQETVISLGRRVSAAINVAKEELNNKTDNLDADAKSNCSINVMGKMDYLNSCKLP